MCTSVTPTSNYLPHQNINCCSACSCQYPYPFIYTCSSLSLEKSRLSSNISSSNSKAPVMNNQSNCKSGNNTCCGCSSTKQQAINTSTKSLNVSVDSQNPSTPSTINIYENNSSSIVVKSSGDEQSVSSESPSQTSSTNLLTTTQHNSYSTLTSPSYHHSFTQSHLHSEEHIEPTALNEIKPVKEASEATTNYFKIVFGSSINDQSCANKPGSCECSGCNYSVGQSNRGAAIVAIQAHLPPTPRGSSNGNTKKGGCKGSSSGSVKIQKKSVMQNKLKSQLTRLRDSGLPGSSEDSEAAMMNGSDSMVINDSGIIISTN